MRLLALLTYVTAATAACDFAQCAGTGGICVPFNPITGVCTPVGNLWGSLDLNLAASLGIDLGAFNANLTASLNGSAAVAVLEGQILKAQSDFNAAVTLGAAASANAALQVEAQAQIAINSVIAAATKAFIAVQTGANATFNSVQVQANKALAVGLSTSIATFNSLQLAAQSTLTVSGSGSINFPGASASVTADASAWIVVAGGASTTAKLAGNVGNAAITVNAATTATVQGTLTTSGRIVGQGSVAVQAGANLVFNAVATANANITLAISGSLQVSGSGAPASASSFGTIASCAQGGSVTLQLQGTLASAPTSGTIFTYASLSGSAVPQCSVILKGTDGATLTLTAARGARRLLADGEANWGSSSLTYTTNNNSPAPRAVFSFSIVVAMLAAVFAFRQ